MGLLSNFTRKRESSSMAPLPADALDSVQAARAKARHRLIGAVVLLLVGIIGFPIVFETQPRPTPVDIAIEIPRKENAPPLVAPAARALPAPPAASAMSRHRGVAMTARRHASLRRQLCSCPGA